MTALHGCWCQQQVPLACLLTPPLLVLPMFCFLISLVLPLVLLQVGGSGVLVQPMTYIFDEEPARWTALLETLGVSPDSVKIA